MRKPQWLAIDMNYLHCSLSTFVAAAIVLVISFVASLPRPWWALLTVYVTAQPMTGPFRPKVLYRIAGIIIGAVVTIALVPNLQNSPLLLVLALSIWTGVCIYLAVLDRTPRAFLFQMAAFSAAVISFPYVYDPSDIFTTTISRVEEMTLAIACVTGVHLLMRPVRPQQVISKRAFTFLAHATRWTAEALGTHHTALEYEHRRQLAADVTELGMIAVNLPADQGGAQSARSTVTELQHRLATLLPLASAAAHRLDRLRALNAVDAETAAAVDLLIAKLRETTKKPKSIDEGLVTRFRSLSHEHTQRADWTSMLTANLCARLASFVETLNVARTLASAIHDPDLLHRIPITDSANDFPISKDHSIAILAGLATTTAVLIYCAFWIAMAWPSAVATAAFAALITCSFAAQDDPAPVISRYLMATLITFPVAALYLFVILPRTDGAIELIVMLAPALIWIGYIQGNPATNPRALPMISCFVVAMGFLDRFNLDFAGFVNTGLAQVGGIVTTLIVTKLFRTANLQWRTHQIVRRNWDDLARLADPSQPLDSRRWTAHAVDRLGQIAARMALIGREDALHAADALVDLRIGRNIIQARQGLERANARAFATAHDALEAVSALYRARMEKRRAVAGSPALLSKLDLAIRAAMDRTCGIDDVALLALVSMRCNLFPNAEALEVSA